MRLTNPLPYGRGPDCVRYADGLTNPLPYGRGSDCVRYADGGHRAASFLVLLALLLGWGNVAKAHEFTFTEVVVLLKSDGAYLIDMTVDVDALALGVASGVASAEVVEILRNLPDDEFAAALAQAERTIATRVRVDFDEQRQRPTVTFPEFGGVRDGPVTIRSAAGSKPEPTLLGITARLSGMMPAEAKEFRFGASRAFQAVHLTIFDQRSGQARKLVLGPSEDSPPWRLGDEGAPLPPESWPTVLARFIKLGFEHILPKGLDHILFVLGLFLLSARLAPLLWQISAFTLAHTLTLALATSGIVSAPAHLVEPLIALSIAYVAFENIITSKLHPWRPALVFLFGLLHGLGFAGVLHELGLPDDAFAAALIGFNVGVELGQFAVIALAFALVGWARNRSWYRARIVIPVSLLIGLMGVFWAVQRTLEG